MRLLAHVRTKLQSLDKFVNIIKDRTTNIPNERKLMKWTPKLVSNRSCAIPSPPREKERNKWREVISLLALSTFSVFYDRQLSASYCALVQEFALTYRVYVEKRLTTAKVHSPFHMLMDIMKRVESKVSGFARNCCTKPFTMNLSSRWFNHSVKAALLLFVIKMLIGFILVRRLWAQNLQPHVSKVGFCQLIIPIRFDVSIKAREGLCQFYHYWSALLAGEFE